jgi:transcription elongation factor Elf1
MPQGFITATCSQCNRGYNVANPLVELKGQHAICPHCGQRTEVDAETMQKAREARGLAH